MLALPCICLATKRGRTIRSPMLAAGTRFGPYEILEPLGSGGMGDVYRARDADLRREVALKVLPPSMASDVDRLARLHREARVLAALNHPHIGAIYGLERSTSTPALVLELVDGPTLAARIARGPLPLREALTIATQVADAVQAAHEKGIIHRDLKPANVSLTAGGSAKVLDFGIAKLRDAEGMPALVAEHLTTTSHSFTTATGPVFGTLAYMSPEQALRQPVDERTDIWAFGCVLFEMLVGRRAFEGQNTSETLSRIVAHEPAWAALPRAVPDDLRVLLIACLEKAPDRRLTRMIDVSQALKHCVARLDNIQPLAARMSALLVPPRRTAALVIGGVAIAAFIVTVARFSSSSFDASASRSRATVTEASQTELIAVLEQRAARILSRFDQMIASTDEAAVQGAPSRMAQELRSARMLFVELHEKHIAALRANQLVLAEELSREIYHLLFFVPQFGDPRSAKIAPPDGVHSIQRGFIDDTALRTRSPKGESLDSLATVIMDYPATARRDLKVDRMVLERVRTKLRSSLK